jgi:hypothetical protein
MSQLPPAVASALRGERPLLFGMVEINLPDYDLFLLDGSGQVQVDNRLFVGRDETYGVLDSIKGLGDSVGDKSKAVTITLLPSSTAALASFVQPNVQGSQVTVSMGVLDIGTGICIGTYILQTGELDVPIIKWGKNTRSLEYSVTGVGERMFQTEEGKRLSDNYHQSTWPGETGLSLVTDVETYVPWGQKLDLTAVETRTDLPAMGNITHKRT